MGDSGGIYAIRAVLHVTGYDNASFKIPHLGGECLGREATMSVSHNFYSDRSCLVSLAMEKMAESCTYLTIRQTKNSVLFSL